MEIVLGDTPSVNIKLLEEKLNDAKSRIGKLPNWEVVKYGNPLFKLKSKNITFGYLKLFEIIKKYNLIPDSSEINYFDACSFPGTFIFCVLKIASQVKTKVNWKAISLISDTKNHLDDLYSLYKDYPDNWLMNYSNNGDITQLKNIKDIISRTEKVDLFTGDFGFDIGDNYAKQEELSLMGLRSQIKLGLGMLNIGGNMIIKSFTLFKEKSQLYISWMIQCFEKTYAYKPYTSSDSNSEIYIIGLNFTGKVELSKIKKLDLSFPISVFVKNQIHRIKYYETCLLEKKHIIYPISDTAWLNKFN